MNKTPFLILGIVMLLLAACQKDRLQPIAESAQEKVANTTPIGPIDFSKATNLSEHFQEDAQSATARSQKTLIFRGTKTLPKGHNWNYYWEKPYFQHGYTYTAVLTPQYGDPDLSAIGFYNNLSNRDVKRSSINGAGQIDETYLKRSDLKSSENMGGFRIYAFSANRYTFELYKELDTTGGICQGTPIRKYCIGVWDPVCGCDGNTYSSSCTAETAGIFSWTQGECNTDNTCMGPPSGVGVCTLEYAPVCGCNGVTYGNDCDARASGVLSWTDGPCNGGGNTCMGTPTNDICTTLYAPVCGCNGVTYSNDCVARAAGVLSWSAGTCGN